MKIIKFGNVNCDIFILFYLGSRTDPFHGPNLLTLETSYESYFELIEIENVA